MTTNVDVAAAAIDTASRFIASDGYPALRVLADEEYARIAFNASDPRLADLTPEDTTAILDMFIVATAVAAAKSTNPDLARIREVLSR